MVQQQLPVLPPPQRFKYNVLVVGTFAFVLGLHQVLVSSRRIGSARNDAASLVSKERRVLLAAISDGDDNTTSSNDTSKDTKVGDDYNSDSDGAYLTYDSDIVELQHCNIDASLLSSLRDSELYNATRHHLQTALDGTK
jgi:hypothetical protein